MATNTTYYNLTKPAGTDNYDIGVQNGNMDIIDAALYGLTSVATTTSKGLMSATDKAKLNGIEAGAQVNPGNATQSAAGLMSSTDKTKLDGIESGAQVNPGNATQSAAGLMSAADKTKLDGVATGATANVVSNSLSDSSTTNALSAAKGKELYDKAVKSKSLGTFSTEAAFATALDSEISNMNNDEQRLIHFNFDTETTSFTTVYYSGMLRNLGASYASLIVSSITGYSNDKTICVIGSKNTAWYFNRLAANSQVAHYNDEGGFLYGTSYDAIKAAITTKVTAMGDNTFCRYGIYTNYSSGDATMPYSRTYFGFVHKLNDNTYGFYGHDVDFTRGGASVALIYNYGIWSWKDMGVLKNTATLTNTDLNNVKTTGIYYTTSTTTNSPAAWSMLYVLRLDDTSLAQYAICVTSGYMYVRASSTNGWTSWKQLAFNDDVVHSETALGTTAYTTQHTVDVAKAVKHGNRVDIQISSFANSGVAYPTGEEIFTVPSAYRPSATVKLPAMLKHTDGYWYGSYVKITSGGAISQEWSSSNCCGMMVSGSYLI